MDQVIGAWWTYLVYHLLAIVLFYFISKLRRKYLLKKLIKSMALPSDDDIVYVADNENCSLQLSMVLPNDDNRLMSRIQPLLQTSLDDNFSQMRGELHPIDESFTVVTYSMQGEGPSNGLRIFKEFDHIVSQERIPYHLIAVKRLGSSHNPWAYSTLNEVNKLGSFE